jgi:hypothetical protein
MFKQFLKSKESIALKRLFEFERNKDILIPFLNDMVTHNQGPMIRTAHFVQRESSSPSHILSALCEDETGKSYHLEIYYGESKSIESELKKLEKQPHIVLIILEDSKFPETKEYRTVLKMSENEFLIFYELPKFTKTIDQLSSTLDKWLYLLKEEKSTTIENNHQLIGNDWVIKRAIDELQEKNDLKKGFLIHFPQTSEKVIEIGKNETKMDIARRMLTNGIGLDIISKCTDLSFEEISTLLPALTPKTKGRNS